MALLTPLSLDDARRLGARYDLSVASVSGIPAGSVNSNYALTLDDGARVFLRVYEEQTQASARGEALLLDHLAAHGVATPRPFRLRDEAGAFIAEHAGKPVAVFPWAPGEALCQARVTPDAAFQVGAALARVHVAGESYAGASRSRFGVTQLAERIRGLERTALPAELVAVVERLARRLERFEHRDPDKAPGAGLVHGDLFRDNVLWEGGAISALLDFESASRESRPFDLMVTILAWCFTDELSPALAHALAQGYVSVRPLPEEEAARLHEEGCFAALRFSVTRITDFELRPQGSGVYKDFRRFLARGDALDALGPAGLRTLLGV
jgi:homoserine kinase type II